MTEQEPAKHIFQKPKQTFKSRPDKMESKYIYQLLANITKETNAIVEKFFETNKKIDSIKYTLRRFFNTSLPEENYCQILEIANKLYKLYFALMEFERDYFQDLPDDYREYFTIYKKYIQSVLEAVEVKVEVQKLIVKSGISIKTWSGIKAAPKKRVEFNKACAKCFDDGVEVNKIAQRLKEVSQENS